MADYAVFGSREEFAIDEHSSFFYLLDGKPYSPKRAMRCLIHKRKYGYNAASMYLGQLVLAEVVGYECGEVSSGDENEDPGLAAR